MILVNQNQKELYQEISPSESMRTGSCLHIPQLHSAVKTGRGKNLYKLQLEIFWELLNFPK